MNRRRSIVDRLKSALGRRARLPIATRITLSFLSVIILSSLIFTLVGARIISDLITSEAEERVRNDLNAARLIYADNIDHVRDAAEFTAVRTFIEDILQGNIPTAYIDELIWFKVSEGLDILTITDANGIVVFRTNDTSHYGDDQSRQELVAAVLRTKVPAAGTVIVSA